MDKLRKMILNCSEKIVSVFFVIFVLYLFYLSLFNSCIMSYTDEHVFFVKDYPGLLLLFLLLFLFFFLVVHIKYSLKFSFLFSKKFLAFITVCWFVVLSVWLVHVSMEPFWDQKFVFDAARDFLEGDYSAWGKGEYMQRFAFQNTLVVLYFPFHMIFGEDTAVLAFQFFNLGCWYLTIIALCLLTQNYYGEKLAKLVYLVLLSFLPMWGYIAFVYGNVPGLCFALWGIYFENKYEETKKTVYMALMAVFLILAVMWKGIYLIAAIAAAVMLILCAIREKTGKPFLGIAFLVILYIVGVNGSVSMISSATGVQISGGEPLIAWIVEGITESFMAPGWYGGGEAEKIYLASGGDAAAVETWAWQKLYEVLAVFAENPSYAVRFFARKICSMWDAPMFECMMVITKNYISGTDELDYIVKDILYNGGLLNTLLFLWMNIMQTVMYFGLILLLIFNRKDLKLKKACLPIMFLGGFLFLIIWEGKCQYALPFFIILIPFSVKGYQGTVFYFSELVKGRKGERGNVVRMLWKEFHIRLLIYAVIMVFALEMIPEQISTNIVKLDIETSDYIWFCQNETAWKEEGYRRE